jgi:hypothetical protein
LWVTEIGWDVEPGGETAEQQSTNLTYSFNWIKANAAADNIKTVVWYDYRDTHVLGNWADHCGLRKAAENTFRPAWYAYQRADGAPEWPIAEWHTDNLGGNIVSDPDMSSRGPYQLNVFGQSSGNALLTKWYDGNWSEWTEVLPSVPLKSGPGAVAWSNSRVDVVGLTTGGSIAHWAWNGTTWASDNLGGYFQSDPDISSWGENRLDVFARTEAKTGQAANQLMHKWYPAGTPSGWSGWETLPQISPLASGPTAVSSGFGRIDVFALSTSNKLEHWIWNGSSWSVEELPGGEISSAPDAASMGNGTLFVYARGPAPKYELISMWYYTSWSGYWAPIPGGAPLSSGPGAVSWGNERVDVTARTATNTVQHWAYGKEYVP